MTRQLGAANSQEEFAARFSKVQRVIEDAGRDVTSIQIVAVTKGFEAAAIFHAVRTGIADIGENYANELMPKITELDSVAPEDARQLRWHFLGAIQRNKIGLLSSRVSVWQTVCRIEEGESIARKSPDATIFVEVNYTGDPERNGCSPTETPALVGELRQCGLTVAGLMTVAPQSPEEARTAFRGIRVLADELGIRERSMGMSGDFALAVAEGSTMIRLGSALFGERPIRDRVEK